MAEQASAHAGLIDRMHDEGHEVALHCVRHVRHTELDEAELREDTEQGLRTLVEVGATVRRWRPPWGVVTDATRRIAGEYDLEVVCWDIDTQDWRGDRAGRMHRRVRRHIGAGSVVLMHDGVGPGARRTDCRDTVELIPRLSKTLEQRRLRAVPLSENAP
jgi:peptidoglycan/xylan/chitin deacetylase (PgdA/CDA1 family)